MDRLVCGDVGFGKTEVALRASFVAVMGGKQVAILAPTTLLAEQHVATWKDRFADWPVRIVELSRFKTTKEINDAYQHDIAVIRAYFAKRVQHNPSSGSVPSLPVAPAGTNEGSPYTALIEQCVETTDQLVQLQNWVKSEESIK